MQNNKTDNIYDTIIKIVTQEEVIEKEEKEAFLDGTKSVPHLKRSMMNESALQYISQQEKVMSTNII